MNPSTLTFTREIRFSVDVIIRFVPRNTTEEIVHRQGHIFLLSDLFLICDKMSPEEQAQHAVQGADMWLCYPPLAGKVLRVVDIEGRSLYTFEHILFHCAYACFRSRSSGCNYAKGIPYAGAPFRRIA